MHRLRSLTPHESLVLIAGTGRAHLTNKLRCAETKHLGAARSGTNDHTPSAHCSGLATSSDPKEFHCVKTGADITLVGWNPKFVYFVKCAYFKHVWCNTREVSKQDWCTKTKWRKKHAMCIGGDYSGNLSFMRCQSEKAVSFVAAYKKICNNCAPQATYTDLKDPSLPAKLKEYEAKGGVCRGIATTA